jgi:hypothetical protein
MTVAVISRSLWYQNDRTCFVMAALGSLTHFHVAGTLKPAGTHEEIRSLAVMSSAG